MSQLKREGTIMVKCKTIQTWIIRIVVLGLVLGILLLNVKVLSKRSQSEDKDSTANNLLSLKGDLWIIQIRH